MKVKDFIKELEKLDQERDIWMVYDTYGWYEPEVEILEKDAGEGKAGDYIMELG